MGLIALHNFFGGVDAFRYGMFFFVVFIWLGLFEARWRSLRMAPFALVAYVVPLLLHDASASDLASISYALPLYMLVGEVLAWRSVSLRDFQHRLQDMAERDVLTGLPNRAVFDEALRAAVDERAEVAVIFIDLDGFKAINDRLGHQAGDDVLVRVADVLHRSVRVEHGICRAASRAMSSPS
jgi:predicted signal transduction protein with EAL and GGDEF domain